jgi:hypothetical protein
MVIFTIGLIDARGKARSVTSGIDAVGIAAAPDVAATPS